MRRQQAEYASTSSAEPAHKALALHKQAQHSQQQAHKQGSPWRRECLSSVCVCVLIIARPWLGRNTANANYTQLNTFEDIVVLLARQARAAVAVGAAPIPALTNAAGSLAGPVAAVRFCVAHRAQIATGRADRRRITVARQVGTTVLTAT